MLGGGVESFVPERWLSDDPERQKHILDMGKTLFQFGSGRFGCIGKIISLLEMYKVIPSILLKFNMSLAVPEAEWSPGKDILSTSGTSLFSCDEEREVVIRRNEGLP